jgi:hypothetical protein
MSPPDVPSTRPLLAKLGVKPGQRAVLLGRFEPDFVARLKAHGLTIAKRVSPEAPLIFFRAERPAALRALPTLARALADTGALWLIRPKGKDTPLTEHQSRAAGLAAGLVDIKVVAFSATHSAEKYVVPVQSRGKRR